MLLRGYDRPSRVFPAHVPTNVAFSQMPDPLSGGATDLPDGVLGAHVEMTGRLPDSSTCWVLGDV